MAQNLKHLATCPRRQVGAVLVNKNGQIVGSGYNGAAAGLAHCIDTPCNGFGLPSGTGLEACEAIHAEQNALLQCSNIHDIYAAYVTCPPCMHCTKLLLQTSCQVIVSTGAYVTEGETKQLWQNANRQWEKL